MANVSSAVIAALITIPIVIARAQSDKRPTVEVPETTAFTQAVAESETETASREYLNPYHEYSFMTGVGAEITEVTTEPVTEAPTEAPYAGYEFIPLDADIQVQIFTLCEQYEIAYELVLAVIKTESEFQFVTGDGGKSIGYMQIQPRWWQATADAHGLDISNPVDNVHLGIIILTKLLDLNNGSLDKALKQYNSGDPNYPGNEYISKVYANYEWLLNQLESEE